MEHRPFTVCIKLSVAAQFDCVLLTPGEMNMAVKREKWFHLKHFLKFIWKKGFGQKKKLCRRQQLSGAVYDRVTGRYLC